MEDNRPQFQGIKPALYMLLAMAMWAVIEEIAGGFSQHYSSFQIVWMRYSIHLLTLIVFFGPRARQRLVRTQRLPLQLARGGLMMGMHLCFIFAVRSLTVNTTMAGFWIAPILLLGLSAWIGEKADRLTWLVTLVGVGCVLVTLRPIEGIFHPASLLSVGMAVCFVVYMQLTRAMPGETMIASLFYTAFSVWVVLSFLMPFYWVTPTARDLLIFAAIGLLGIVCIYGFDRAAELGPTWVSAPYTLIQPVLILVFNQVFRLIHPGRLSLAAVGAILTGFTLLGLRMLRYRKTTGTQYV